jgi:hypothetical protein
MLKNIILLLWSSSIIMITNGLGLETGDAIIQVNDYYRNNGNYNSLPPHIRWASILNVAIHNAINSVHPYSHYQTFRNVTFAVTDHSKAAEIASVLGVFYTVKRYAIEHDLISNTQILFFPPTSPLYTSQINSLNNFTDTLKSQIYGDSVNIENGYNFGIEVANELLNEQANDGWNATVPNYLGVYPYVPGQWYTAVYSDGVTYAVNTSDFTNRGALNPNWAIMDPMGITSSISINVIPRPQLNTTEFVQSFQETYNCGELSNYYQIRSSLEESDALAMVIAPSQVFINKFVELIVDQNRENLNDYDIGYLYALSSLSLHDSAVHNTYWKQYYNFDRPIQLIYNGGGTLYPQYIPNHNWTFLRNGAPNPEYPCAHCENTGAGIEAIRLALINIGLVNNTNNNNDTLPGGPITICEGYGTNSSIVNNCLYPITFGKFVEFKDRVVRARVCGGMHYTISGRIGRLVGEQIASFNCQHHLIPLSNNYNNHHHSYDYHDGYEYHY